MDHIRVYIQAILERNLPRVLAFLTLSYWEEKIECIRTWKIEKERPSEMCSITLLLSGEVAIMDKLQQCIRVFTSEGKLHAEHATLRCVRKWGTYGDGHGEFCCPHSITTLPSGELVVADTGNHRMQIFAANGSFLCMWGRKGNGPGEFYSPEGVSTLPSGEIIVADTHNHRIQVFAANGSFLRMWGKKGRGAGEFCYPLRAVPLPAGEVAIVDKGNKCIQIFTCEGKFLHAWRDERLFNYQGDIAALPSGKVFVVADDCVQVFSPEGKYLHELETGLEVQRAFDYPYVITSSLSGEIIIADPNYQRIHVFCAVFG